MYCNTVSFIKLYKNIFKPSCIYLTYHISYNILHNTILYQDILYYNIVLYDNIVLYNILLYNVIAFRISQINYKLQSISF